MVVKEGGGGGGVEKGEPDGVEEKHPANPTNKLTLP